MIQLKAALHAWGTPGFEHAFKQEVTALDREALPLRQALSRGTAVTEAPIAVMVNSTIETENTIRVMAGIFYEGEIAGCSCLDDPTTASTSNEYCEVQLDIDKSTAATTITLAP